MKNLGLQIIMAVETPDLRIALTSAIEPLGCRPEMILPRALLEWELSGDNLIFLETQNDVERLISTARALWNKWGETGKAGLHFLSYSTADVTPDALVFRLWSIGPEMTVIVQAWTSERLREYQGYAYAFTRRVLESYPR